MNALRAHSIPVASTSDAVPLGLMTLVEVARELRCSMALLYKVQQGRIQGLPPLPVFHIGRKPFIRQCQLQAWIRSLEDMERENLYASGNFGIPEDQWESIAGA